MKYSYNWLKELSGTEKSPEKMVEDLTFHSFEVEGVEKVNDDTIIEIKILPDRAHDAMSHVGVAREIAILENKNLDYDFDGLMLPKKKTEELNVEIKDEKLCSRYIGAVMENAEIKDSPEWMKKRLEASGIRTINNVVDATNYVMLELGQPLHAFDIDKLKAKSEELKIVVRKAKNGEKIELLDGVAKELKNNNLLITDGGNPLAIAGIKGGKLAEIDTDTKKIILEAANFNAVSIRRTRTELDLRTDSSDRFEKDIDPNLAEKAMVRLIEIIEKTAGGKLTGVEDIYPKPVKFWTIKLDLRYINDLLGEIVPTGEIARILELLKIEIDKKTEFFNCIIPTYRIDLKTQEDLIEEIGRIWGYEKIKEQPLVFEVLPAKTNEMVKLERKIQDILIGLSFDEVYNYSFYSRKEAEICGLSGVRHFELENPMNPEQELVRASLIPNILRNVRENLKNFKEFSIFEIGKAYTQEEEKRLLAFAQVFEKESELEMFRKFKGAVEDLLDGLGIKNVVFEKSENGALIKINGEILGEMKEMNSGILLEYKIKNQTFIAELNLEKIKKVIPKEKIYKPISKFPTVTRDVSLLDKSNLTVLEISSFIKKTGGSLITSVELFDIFQKNNETSYAFHINFGADRTLEGKEVDEIMEKIISGLESELKVEIRK